MMAATMIMLIINDILDLKISLLSVLAFVRTILL